MALVERIKGLVHVDPYANFASERTGERLRKLLSPHWLASKVALTLYEKRHPDHPWITREAIELFDALLRPHHVGLEWGSGNGTPWVARRCKSLISVEHHERWYQHVRELLTAEELTNVDYRLVSEAAYVATIDTLPDGSLDFVIVDGLFRDEAFLRSIPKLRPDGFVVFDNVNWYLPSESRTPHSRSRPDGPASPGFAEVDRETERWRIIWTSNGVNDTAIFIKPA
jgi:predicted O-methyltransferase YrrM